MRMEYVGTECAEVICDKHWQVPHVHSVREILRCLTPRFWHVELHCHRCQFIVVVSYLRVTAVSLLGVFTVRCGGRASCCGAALLLASAPLVSVTLLLGWSAREQFRVGATRLRSVRLSVDQAPPSFRGHFPGFGLGHRTGWLGHLHQ